MNKISKLLYRLVDTRAAGVYILLFAASIGLATFIENDFGTSAAQKVVYQSRWFTVLLALFSFSILANIRKFRMIQQRKWALLSFHLAIIIILIGAAHTRYFGYEGIMHIRENDASSEFLSSNAHLKFRVLKDGQTYAFDEPVLFASLGNNDWSQSYLLGEDLLSASVKEVIPNPGYVIEENQLEGVPILKVVMGGMNGREEYFISRGESRIIGNTVFNFTETMKPSAINLSLQDGQLLIRSETPMSETVMATQQNSELEPSEWHQLKLRALYAVDGDRFVFGEYHPKGTVSLVSTDRKIKNESVIALKLDLQINSSAQEAVVYGQKGSPGQSRQIHLEGMTVEVAYGSKPVTLPFSVHLYDFIMERYPGTNNAASYASEIHLSDPRNQTEMDFRIYMNNILNYDGYRFFQSSFDQDEMGTYLSVNHDYWGTVITYIGYFLLTLGMILTLFNSKSRFAFLNAQLKKMRTASIMVLLFIISLHSANAQRITDPDGIKPIQAEHAAQFSRMIVQDHRGRMKPMHTLSREILRKVARKESIGGQNADQVILGMFTNRVDWLHIPMIKLGKNENLKSLLGVENEKVKYADFFNQDGSYKLQSQVRQAYSMEPADRGTFEKELIKVDERVNILNMVFTGRIFRIIPIQGDENNTWIASETHGHNDPQSGEIASRFFPAYQSALTKGLESGDYSLADQLLKELAHYQAKFGGAVYPSDLKVSLEIFLNRLNIFSRLAAFYALFGLAFLFLLFFTIFKPTANIIRLFKVLFWLLVAGFALHTIGLGTRWYVSGRAPWSNGYESMIYIAWTSTLAGLIFTRKSLGGLAATMVLASTILLVALISHMDPEITPLVPVLKSYWLTIHVSLEAGSYGFLMLGAVIGIINLILMIFLKSENKERINRIVTEMTYLSELTLIVGLIMISTGTYLGGIWANESWGRYWGWDAKETWALVTILVYAFILHMRVIPKLYSLYYYNLATVFGLGSVIMTYYGVNYYLSGLHSYAAGDPVPIPTWVYIMVASICLISALAYMKNRKFKMVLK